jgi:hypothetical protein
VNGNITVKVAPKALLAPSPSGRVGERETTMAFATIVFRGGASVMVVGSGDRRASQRS